jgi:hypothetical protein
MGTNPPSKDNASKEEKADARKLCSSLQDDPVKFETSAQWRSW